MSLDLSNFDLSSVDPAITGIGQVAGIVTTNNKLNEKWFNNPHEELWRAFNDPQQREALPHLLDHMLGSQAPLLEDLPAADNGEVWFPLGGKDVSSKDNVGKYLFLVTCNKEEGLDLGVGGKWDTDISKTVTFRSWIHLPLLCIKSQKASDPPASPHLGVLLGEDDGPIQLGFDLICSDSKGLAIGDEMYLNQAGMSAQIYFQDIPKFALKVKLTPKSNAGITAEPLELSFDDIAKVDKMMLTQVIQRLVVALLGEEITDPAVRHVINELLPILGIGDDIIPSLDWSNMIGKPGSVWKAWFLNLINNQTLRDAWMGHWKNLLHQKVPAGPSTVDGVGTRADPWRVNILEVAAYPVRLDFTLAVESAATGQQTAYPGLLVSSPQVPVATTNIAIESVLELFSIPLSDLCSTIALPSFDFRLRWSGQDTLDSGYLLRNYATPMLGNVTLKDIVAGLRLDPGSKNLVPVLEMSQVACSVGNWSVVDLSSIDKVVNAVSDQVEQVITKELVDATGVDSPGKHVAALLALLDPTADHAPTPWPVTRPLIDTASSNNLEYFLSNPPDSLARYHILCMETQAGSPALAAWRYLFAELVELFRHASGANLPMVGQGSKDDPWSLEVWCDTALGSAFMQAWLEPETDPMRLGLALKLAPKTLAVASTGAELGLEVQFRLLEVDMPHANRFPAIPSPVLPLISAVWLPSITGKVLLKGSPPTSEIRLPSLAGLEISASQIALSTEWMRRYSFAWKVTVEGLRASFTDPSISPLSFPSIEFDNLNWDWSLPTLGSLGPLLKLVLGRFLIKFSGSFGFSLAGLLGLLPDFPHISLPDLPDWSSGPFKLPFDWPGLFDLPSLPGWPELPPFNWPDFFTNPWPALNLRFAFLLGNPNWSLPSLTWLGGLFHGRLPDFSLPHFGWDFSSGSLKFPDVQDLFTLQGSGVYADPWALSLRKLAERQVELLVWIDKTATPPSYIGVGVRVTFDPAALTTPTVPSAEFKSVTVVRYDIKRFSLKENTPASGPEQLPRVSIINRLSSLDTGSYLIGSGGTSIPRVKYAEIGVEWVPDQTAGKYQPILRLYDAALGSVKEDVATLLAQSGDGQPAFQPSATLRPLLDLILQQFTQGTGAVPSFNQACALLQDFQLLTAVDQGGYVLDSQTWLALLADPKKFFHDAAATLFADPGRSAAFFHDLSTCLGLDLSVLSGLVNGTPSPEWNLLRAALAGLNLLAPATQNYVLLPGAWSQVIAQPEAFLQDSFNNFCQNGALNALLSKLRSATGLSNGPQKLTSWLSYQVDPTNALLEINLSTSRLMPDQSPVNLVGNIAIDLGRKTLDASISVAYNEADSRLRDTLPVLTAVHHNVCGQAVQNQLRLDWNFLPESNRSLVIAPITTDFATQVGHLVPPLALSALASTLVAQLLQPVSSSEPVGLLLQELELASYDTANAQWKTGSLTPLVAAPLEWLKKHLFVNGDSTLDPAKLSSLTRALLRAAGLPNSPDGAFRLPYGLALRANTAAPARISITTDTPLALPEGISLGFTLDLTSENGTKIMPDGTIDLLLPLPASAPLCDQLKLETNLGGGSFSLGLRLKGGTDTIRILPFQGWNAKLASSVATPLIGQLEDIVLSKSGLKTTGWKDVLDALVSAPLPPAPAQLEVWLTNKFIPSLGPLLVQYFGTGIPNAVLTFDSVKQIITFGTTPSILPITLELGCLPAENALGIQVNLNQVPAGPVEITLAGSAFLKSTSEIGTTFNLGLRLKDNIDLNVLSLNPGISAGWDGSQLDARLRLQLGAGPHNAIPLSFGLVPNPCFCLENDQGQPTDAEDAVERLVKKFVAPLAIELLLEIDEIKAWLDTKISNTVSCTPLGMLSIANLLVKEKDENNKDVIHLTSIDTLIPKAGDSLDYAQFVSRLIAAGLGAIAPVTLVDNEQYKLVFAKTVNGSIKEWGVQLVIKDLLLCEDPEIKFIVDQDTTWADLKSTAEGIIFNLVRYDGSKYSFNPEIELNSLGINISGAGQENLIDEQGFTLAGIEPRVYLKVTNIIPPDRTSGVPKFDFAVKAGLNRVGLPIGAGGGDSSSNPVAQSMLANNNPKDEPVNPAFDLAVTYKRIMDEGAKGKFGLILGDGKEEKDEIWLQIQRQFGPIYIQQVGLGWDQTNLSILLDGGVHLSMLAVDVDGLTIRIPVFHITDLSQWGLDLQGLAVGYASTGLTIAGGLRKAPILPPAAGVEYDGLLLINYNQYSIAAMGSYAHIERPEDYTSMFVFAVLSAPLGGPPYFFILGAAGGFGFNRGLIIPSIENVSTFPFVAAAVDPSTISSDPMAALKQLSNFVRPSNGSYWLAAGIKFTVCQLLDGFAMLYVIIDDSFEIGLLGVAGFVYPKDSPIIGIEMALKVRLSIKEGVFSMQAQLTDRSFLFSEDCRLTGGFAFFIWFGGEHAGDFVISLGGYHPNFSRPDHYPLVPPLGFNWRLSDCLVIKGENYFALTSRAIMAGGSLEASFDGGDLKASFTAWAHFLIEWKPFYYDIDIGICIKASYTDFFHAEISAELHIWGPEFTGFATLNWTIISATIWFGDQGVSVEPDKIGWDEFRDQFLLPPPEPNKPRRIFTASVESGRQAKAYSREGAAADKAAVNDWVLEPEFTLRTETRIASSGSKWLNNNQLKNPEVGEIDIRPMHETSLTSIHVVNIQQYDKNGLSEITEHASQIQFEEIVSKVPGGLWDYADSDDPLNGTRQISAITGARISVIIQNKEPFVTVPLETYEPGQAPLPFASQVWLDPSLVLLAQQADLLSTYGVISTSDVLLATKTLLSGENWQQRRRLVTRQLRKAGIGVPRASSQYATSVYYEKIRHALPRLATLYRGMGVAPRPLVPVRFVPAAAAPVVRPLPRIPRLSAVLEHASPNFADPLPTKVPHGTALSIPHIPVSQAIGESLHPGSLQRFANLKAARPTGRAGSAVSKNNFASSANGKLLFALEQAAIQPGKAPQADIGGVTLPDSAAILSAGQAQVWDLPTRGAVGDLPTLTLHGNQVVRVTALSKGGVPLLDREHRGTASVTLPANTTRVILSGLGSTLSQEAIKPGMAATKLLLSQGMKSACGWISTSALLQVGDTTLLGAGCVLRTGGRVRTRREDHVTRHAVVTAAEVTLHQECVETYLPASIRTAAIWIDYRGIDKIGQLSDRFAVRITGAQVSDKPQAVVSGQSILLLYEVKSVDDENGIICVSVSRQHSFDLAGVEGLMAAADDCRQLCTGGVSDRQVPAELLAPEGETRFAFWVG
jgi:hypothetical protein